MTWGAPSAGTTSWGETNFFFSTINAAPATLDTMLRGLREVATDLTFRADAVDEGRAQVVAEMAARRAGNETYARFVRAVAPGSPNDVVDAQNSDDVPTAGVASIRSLYRRLYRPGGAMIVVVGNVDVAATVSAITTRFGDWADHPMPSQARAVPRLDTARIAPISVTVEPGGRRVAIMTSVNVTPPVGDPDQQAAATLMAMMAQRAATGRLNGMPEGGGARIDDDQGYRQMILWRDFAGAWEPSTAFVAGVACNLVDTGFSAREWGDAKAAVSDDLARAAAEADRADNLAIAKDVSHALAAGRVPPSSVDLWRRAQVVLPRIDASAATTWWRRQWRGGTDHLRVESDSNALPPPTPASVRAVVNAAAAPCPLRR